MTDNNERNITDIEKYDIYILIETVKIINWFFQ